MSKQGAKVNADLAETAVPTLKVMRLQRPDLQMPTAGTLDNTCILGSSMALPDSFGVINVGETFTAYLGALNVSKDLPVMRLTVTAQLQTPSQKCPLKSSLDGAKSDVPPGGGVDTIVSHPLEEQGQHILRVEVGYGGSDGGTKTLRKFYRFNVSCPLTISELTLRSGDASCFVSIAVENSSGTGLTISSTEFQCSEGLVAERIGKTNPTEVVRKEGSTPRRRAVDLFDRCGRLEPGASFRYLFAIKAATQDASLRGIACGDELGVAIFTWKKTMGETGRIASSPVICPQLKPPGLVTYDGTPESNARFMTGGGSNYVVHGSGLSVDVAATAANRSVKPFKEKSITPELDQVLPITVEPVDPPTRMDIEVPKQVQFLIVNHSNKLMNLQLQMRLTHMDGIVVCGKSFQNLGEVPPSGGSQLIGVRLVALVAGLLKVQGCCIVDLSTGKEIPQPPLFHVFVESASDE